MLDSFLVTRAAFADLSRAGGLELEGKLRGVIAVFPRLGFCFPKQTVEEWAEKRLSMARSLPQAGPRAFLWSIPLGMRCVEKDNLLPLVLPLCLVIEPCVAAPCHSWLKLPGYYRY